MGNHIYNMDKLHCLMYPGTQAQTKRLICLIENKVILKILEQSNGLRCLQKSQKLFLWRLTQRCKVIIGVPLLSK